MTQLETDSANRAEYVEFALRRAALVYADRREHGDTAWQARAQALAYFRRKTELPEPIAAGALDRELTKQE